MTGESWNIYWNEYAADTCLYGSDLLFHRKDDVEFRNLLLPPGTVIREWYSKTSYQLQRIEPALPMIDGEGRYQLIRNMDRAGEENCLIRLIFYDRYETEAGRLIIRDWAAEFQCPLKTYSYRMQLISSGAASFRFHSIVIREVIRDNP